MKKNVVIIFVEFMILAVLGAFVCMHLEGNTEAVTASVSSPVQMASVTDGLQSTVETRHVTLIAVGDIMMHQWQITRGYDAATDTFDYADSFTYVKPYL